MEVDERRIVNSVTNSNQVPTKPTLMNFMKCFFFSFLFHFRRKLDLLEHYSLFSLVGDKLMKHSLTLTTYNGLFEVCYPPEIFSFL